MFLKRHRNRDYKENLISVSYQGKIRHLQGHYQSQTLVHNRVQPLLQQ